MRRSRRAAGIGAFANSTELRAVPAVLRTASRSATREKGRSASHRNRTRRRGSSRSSRPASVCKPSSLMGIPAMAAAPSRSTSTASGGSGVGFPQRKARSKVLDEERGFPGRAPRYAMQHDQGRFALRIGGKFPRAP